MDRTLVAGPLAVGTHRRALHLRAFALAIPPARCLFSQNPMWHRASSLGKGQSGHRQSQLGLGSEKVEGHGARRGRGLCPGSRVVLIRQKQGPPCSSSSHPASCSSRPFSVCVLTPSPIQQVRLHLLKPQALRDLLMSHLLWEGVTGPAQLSTLPPTMRSRGGPASGHAGDAISHRPARAHRRSDVSPGALPWARREPWDRPQVAALLPGRRGRRVGEGRLHLGAPSRSHTPEIKGDKWLSARHLGNINFTRN